MKLPINSKQTAIVASVAVFSVIVAIGVFLYFYLKNKISMKISTAGLDIIKQFEGLRLQAYKCSAGVWTIGYGHTKNVQEGDTCTQEQADEWLLEDVATAEKAVNSQALNINQNQFDALVSFTFNVGVSAFKKSTLLKLIMANPNDPQIEAELAKWKYAGGKAVTGLLNRRIAEAQLYFA